MNELLGLFKKEANNLLFHKFLKNFKVKNAGHPALSVSKIHFGGNHNPLILKGGFGVNTNCMSKFPFSKTRL